jgi:septum site-determining protein MinC
LGISGDNELPINLKNFIDSTGLQSISTSSIARSDVANIGGIVPEEADKIINMSSESSADGEITRESQQQHALASKFYQGTVRSGQQIYAQDTGLIILGGVNDGGEVLADGDIHVYGPLSGRVIAGLSEDAKEAKIFIRQFRPSLIGIGDAFIIPDDHPELKRFKDKSVVVSLLAEGGRESANGPIFDSTCVKIACEEGKFLIFTPIASF